MQSRSDRPRRDAESIGDHVEGQVQVVVQDHHRTVFDRQTPEPTLELVAIDDQGRTVR